VKSFRCLSFQTAGYGTSSTDFLRKAHLVVRNIIGLSEFCYVQRAKAIREEKAVRSAGDNSTGGHASFADQVANEVQIDRVAEIWQIRPFRLEEFQAPTSINYEIHFARSIPPE
jgi:hypothetical protein